MTTYDSVYDDPHQFNSLLEEKGHRAVIGGMWDGIGQLQFDFLREAGLAPSHKLLDVGCGSLRGGVRFVDYLEPGHYFGADLNEALLERGYAVELAVAGLQEKCPRSNLVTDARFDFPGIDADFDYALAVSVFTHLNFNRIRLCLEKLPRRLQPGGVFFASYFEAPETAPTFEPHSHEPGGVTTWGDRDPFHYRTEDFVHAAKGLPWRVERIGSWNHPRDQLMLAFTRLPGAG